jgi:hypothetical protein
LVTIAPRGLLYYSKLWNSFRETRFLSHPHFGLGDHGPSVLVRLFVAQQPCIKNNEGSLHRALKQWASFVHVTRFSISCTRVFAELMDVGVTTNCS